MFATYLHAPSAGERRDTRTVVLLFSGTLPRSKHRAENPHSHDAVPVLLDAHADTVFCHVSVVVFARRGGDRGRGLHAKRAMEPGGAPALWSLEGVLSALDRRHGRGCRLSSAAGRQGDAGRKVDAGNLRGDNMDWLPPPTPGL